MKITQDLNKVLSSLNLVYSFPVIIRGTGSGQMSRTHFSTLHVLFLNLWETFVKFKVKFPLFVEKFGNTPDCCMTASHSKYNTSV